VEAMDRRLDPRSRRVLLPVAALLACAACTPEEELVDGLYTTAEWEKIKALSPLPKLPPDPTNRLSEDPKAAAFGQRLFHETAYAGPLTIAADGENGGAGAVGELGKLSCASCHEGPWLIDLRSQPGNVSLGAAYLPRNSGSLVNAAFYFPWIENDGLLDSLWSESMIDIEFDLSFNSSRLRLAHVLYEKHRDEYNALFEPDLDPALDPAHPDAARFPADGRPGSDAWKTMTAADQDHVTGAYVNFGKAIHAWLRLLVSGDSPFDRYVAGDTSALGPAAKRGLKLFVGKAACVECHDTPHFSDDEFHNNGLVAAGPNVVTTEEGRFATVDFVLGHEFNTKSKWSDDPNDDRLDGLKKEESQKGTWRTKGLRQIAETAPYMHTGQFATLEEVVDFYDKADPSAQLIGERDPVLQPLNLSASEKTDLVEFLRSLTGEEVPSELLRDPAG
jgi:cytochrome c peroxidase